MPTPVTAKPRKPRKRHMRMSDLDFDYIKLGFMVDPRIGSKNCINLTCRQMRYDLLIHFKEVYPSPLVVYLFIDDKEVSKLNAPSELRLIRALAKHGYQPAIALMRKEKIKLFT